MIATPNKSQTKLLSELNNFHKKKNKPIYVYSGPPGSGKTWVIALFFENNNIKSHEYITCAFSGKAANVLARRGLPAKTIHSLIYKPIIETIDIPCPKCGGTIQVRKAKNKKKYYICENNPKSCDYISWNKPKKEN